MGPELVIEAASDASLVTAVARGREDALGELYRRYGGPIHGLARRVLANELLAEDVVQEVFVTLWRHPQRFDPGRGSLRAYLLTQAHRRAVDLVRGEAARRRREERDAFLEPDVVDGEADRQLWDYTVGARVREALERLPPAEREAIELAYFGGLTYREVAAVLDEPEGTIKSRIRLGLGRLRESLTASGVLDD